MSKEYIERDAAVAFLENMAASRYLIQCFENKERFPAADVAPVVHGEWIIIDRTEMFTELKCSHCGHKMLTGANSLYPNYCPNCGADMRGVYKDAK